MTMTSPSQRKKISSGLALISIDERKIMDSGLHFVHLNIIPNNISSPLFIYKCVLLFANCKSTITTLSRSIYFSSSTNNAPHTPPKTRQTLYSFIANSALSPTKFYTALPTTHTRTYTHNK